MAEQRAETIEQIWGNFKPDQALEPDSIFRVERPGLRTERWIRNLIKTKESPEEKWFLVGHRGSGKSTALLYVLEHPQVKTLFHPVWYSIEDVANPRNLEYQDLLFSIASRLVEEGLAHKAIGKKLEQSLDKWGYTLVTEINKEQGYEVEVKGGLKAYFAEFMAKLKTQSSTRDVFRKTVNPQVERLIEIINDVCNALHNKLKKPVLLGIDDLDKQDLKGAEGLFGDKLTSLQQPKCHIIYTVNVGLMHKAAFTNLKNNHWYTPNVKMHLPNQREAQAPEGHTLMREFVEKRMNLKLIEDAALTRLLTYGGGVFRQTCRLMQVASDYAQDRNAQSITIADVNKAIAEETNGLLTQLETTDYPTLKAIATDNTGPEGFAAFGLLYNLSLLRYPNDENDWHDVNPVLWKRIDDYRIPQTKPQ